MATASASLVRHIHRFAASEQAAQLPDRELLQRFTTTQEQQAFAALVRRHAPLVFGVCRRVLGNWHDAEDAFQATFLVLARKAGSISKRESIASWLYQVAYHAAIRARAAAASRRKHELSTEKRSEGDPLDELTARELLAALDAELQRLPERYRSPLVLCYLEGQTCDQAARQLGWSLRTLKRRLAGGKQLLRARLARRGVTLSAGLLGGVLVEHAAAAVPAGLVHTTVQTALLSAAGLATAPAAALAEGVLHAMFATKLKIATALVVAVGVAALGIGAITHRALAQRQENAAVAEAPKAKPLTSHPSLQGGQGRKKEPVNEQEMMITGRVVDAKGQPLAEVQVAVVGQPKRPMRGGDLSSHDNQVLGQTKADKEGRFHLKAPRTSSAGFRYVMVVAGSKGHGLGLQRLDPDAEQPAAEIKLPAEQIIRGRILDLQGQPIAGSQVHVTGVGKSEIGMGIPLYFWNPPRRFKPWPEPVTTDKEGRFVLHGLNRDQGVWLQVVDDRFARQWALLPPEKEQKVVALTLAPAQIIEGMVIAEDTGKSVPHAHLTVTAWNDGEFFVSNGTVSEGDADAEGRFRLNPFPGKQFTVTAYAPDGQPYLIRKKLFKWPKGSVKQQVEIKLPRGVLVRGKITEADSDKTVVGATLDYFPRRDNPNQRDDILTGQGGVGAAAVSRDDGVFQMTVLPGQGHLLIQGYPPDYIHLEIGSNEIDTKRPGGRRLYPDGLVALDLKPEEKTKNVEVRLRRGVTIRGRLVGPEGKPIAQALMLCRVNPQLSWFSSPVHVEVRDGRFELHGCDPERTYPAYFLDAHNKLGASVQISGKRKGVTSLVKLTPCGKAVARFVDVNGKPLADVRPFVEIMITPGPHLRDRQAYEKGLLIADSHFNANIDRTNYWTGPKTNRDGRITFPALIPGATYRLTGLFGQGDSMVKDFTVESGKTVDLKDITMQRPD